MSVQVEMGILTNPWFQIVLKSRRDYPYEAKAERTTVVTAANTSTKQQIQVLNVTSDVDRTESLFLKGDFNAHIGPDQWTWKEMTRSKGDPELNANGVGLRNRCWK